DRHERADREVVACLHESDAPLGERGDRRRRAILHHLAGQSALGRRRCARGVDGGVDGLIAVNARAGGHAGPRDPVALLEELRSFGLPVVAAGGVGDPAGFVAMLRLGYAGVQMGTRFIATPECRASEAYKRAIIEASESDVVLTERL